ncbi:hypothetical protein OFO10_05305 [Campylobacter sp. VBCF_06 NA8]|uniref:hypothetical protein n=1 Tax=Campylobacter sp. VBCF_06 NA8 TaxID=2983822 RepID=UPI0022E9CA23|nr:hypothetical protein [Campylobacter sp. VBCF_06 NA8]MDA3046570.1 hypothetical protein [Campylobacter sp. VBCF_06 NA8]
MNFMKNLALVLMALLFWGCSQKEILSSRYDDARANNTIVFVENSPNIIFLQKPNNCVLLGSDSVTYKEILDFMSRDKQYDYIDYIEFGDFYIRSEIRMKTQNKGGNLAKMTNGYLTYNMWHDLEEFKTLNFDIYKCKCKVKECL